MNRLHREHGVDCAEQQGAEHACQSPAPRMGRLVQARARNAIQRRGRDLPRGEVRVLTVQGDPGMLLNQLNLWGITLAMQAGALPADFDSWGWSDALADSIEDGVVSRTDFHRFKSLSQGAANSTWTLKVDFKIDDEREVGKGKGDSEYGHATGKKSSRSRGTNESRSRGGGVKHGSTRDHEESMSGESGMDLGVDVKPVKVGMSSKQGYGAKESSSDSSESEANWQSSQGSTGEDTTEAEDSDSSTSRFRAEKTTMLARIVANVSLSLHHFDLFGGGPVTVKHSFSVAAGDVKYIEDSNITE
jgi:hypothetical protein